MGRRAADRTGTSPLLMTSSGGLHVASRLLWLFVVVFATCLAALSGFFLLSQAVRTSKNREWAGNVNAFVIGASYAVVVRALPVRPTSGAQPR